MDRCRGRMARGSGPQSPRKISSAPSAFFSENLPLHRIRCGPAAGTWFASRRPRRAGGAGCRAAGNLPTGLSFLSRSGGARQTPALSAAGRHRLAQRTPPGPPDPHCPSWHRWPGQSERPALPHRHSLHARPRRHLVRCGNFNLADLAATLHGEQRRACHSRRGHHHPECRSPA